MHSNSRARPSAQALLPNWLGDVVMAVPALRELAVSHDLQLVGRREFGTLLRDGGVDAEIVDYDRRGTDAGIAGLWRSGVRLRAARADLCVVFPPSLRAGALARLAGARHRRGFGGDGRGWLLDQRRSPQGGIHGAHLSDQWLALVRDAPVTAGSAVPQLSVGPLAREAMARLREALELPARGSFIAVAAGATYGPTKRWPRASFIELLSELRSAHGLRSVLVGAPSERAETLELADAVGGVSTAGETDLLGLTGVLAECAVFLGNDSGPMHLAAALGRPTLGIFGSTSPAWTAPRGRHAAVVGPFPVPCTPCFQKQCPIGLPCLVELKAPTVAAALQALSDRVEREGSHA